MQRIGEGAGENYTTCLPISDGKAVSFLPHSQAFNLSPRPPSLLVDAVSAESDADALGVASAASEAAAKSKKKESLKRRREERENAIAEGLPNPMSTLSSFLHFPQPSP